MDSNALEVGADRHTCSKRVMEFKFTAVRDR